MHPLQRGPALSEVPDEIGEKDEYGQGNPDPEITTPYIATALGQEYADTQAEDQQEQRNLVLKADARHDPERNPQLRILRFNDPDEDEDADLPEQKVDEVHGVDVELKEVADRSKTRDCCQEEGESLPAELPGHQAGQQYKSGPPERRKKAHSGWRISEQKPDHFQDQDG